MEINAQESNSILYSSARISYQYFKTQKRKDHMKPWYLCAVFADGGRVAFNKSRESGRKDKMRGKILRPGLRNAINGWKR